MKFYLLLLAFLFISIDASVDAYWLYYKRPHCDQITLIYAKNFVTNRCIQWGWLTYYHQCRPNGNFDRTLRMYNQNCTGTIERVDHYNYTLCTPSRRLPDRLETIGCVDKPVFDSNWIQVEY